MVLFSPRHSPGERGSVSAQSPRRASLASDSSFSSIWSWGGYLRYRQPAHQAERHSRSKPYFFQPTLSLLRFVGPQSTVGDLSSSRSDKNSRDSHKLSDRQSQLPKNFTSIRSGPITNYKVISRHRFRWVPREAQVLMVIVVSNIRTWQRSGWEFQGRRLSR